MNADLADAFHEAGHALGFLACGVRFRYATVRLPGGGGVVAIDTWAPIPPRVRAVVSHAGPLAEARYRRIRHRVPGPPCGEQEWLEHHAYQCGGDRDTTVIRGALAELGLAAAADPFPGQARELLRVHWRAVERIGEALTEHGELSYTDVAHLAGDLR